MKVSEKINESGGLFVEIDKLHPFPFRNVFTPMNLDIMYVNSFGDRSLNKLGRNLTVEELAQQLVSLFSDKWDKLYSTIITEFPVLENYSETIHDNKTDKGKTTDNGTQTTTDKVSAYNNDDFVNNNENSNSTTNTVTNDNTVTHDKTRTVKDNPVKNLQTAISFIKNNSIYPVIFTDVNDTITLNIFD